MHHVAVLDDVALAFGAHLAGFLGADLAGKAIQGIDRAPGGRWQANFIGTDYDVEEGPGLEALEKLITGSPLSRAVVNRFVAGETADRAVATARELADKGLYSTVDRLGEDIRIIART
mgnify:CR=1 FL=1